MVITTLRCLLHLINHDRNICVIYLSKSIAWENTNGWKILSCDWSRGNATKMAGKHRPVIGREETEMT